MKSKRDIENREKSLRRRYKLRLVGEKSARKPCNCVYNKEVEPEEVNVQSSVFSIAPRVSKTLIVLSEPMKIGSCTYGTPNGSWNGTICDSVDVSKHCPQFTNHLSPEEIADSTEEKFLDPKWVFENHPDLAAIMWVTGSRGHQRKSLAMRFVLHIYAVLMDWFLKLVDVYEAHRERTSQSFDLRASEEPGNKDTPLDRGSVSDTSTPHDRIQHTGQDDRGETGVG